MLSISGRIALFLIVVILTPLILLWLLFDFKRLERVALELEPRDDTVPEFSTTSAYYVHWFLRNIIGRMIMVICLPIIAIIGLYQSIFDGDTFDTLGDLKHKDKF
jgi:hypothetical protein